MSFFADRLQNSIESRESFLCAGFDPRLDAVPDFALRAAERENTTEDAVYRALTDYFSAALDALADRVAAVKPNSAFFEALGLGGIRALISVGDMLRERKLPFILDAKRGDIGSTASAYSSAYLGRSKAFGRELSLVEADALTVNPFLGFDTLEPLLSDCRSYGKGLFVLVKTSNPGSGALQGAAAGDMTVSERISAWLEETGVQLRGECGYSSIGAVVGATHPQEAAGLRKLMPNAFLLIPGMGAQGASAEDAIAGFSTRTPRGGAVVNVSRGLFSFSSKTVSKEEAQAELKANADKFNTMIRTALAAA